MEIREQIANIIHEDGEYTHYGNEPYPSEYSRADQILNIPIQQPCKECGGDGKLPETGRGSDGFIPCGFCEGTGYKEVTIKEMIGG